MIKVKQKGSKNPKARAWEGGASAFTAMLSFFSVPPSRRKVLGAKPKQAGKKEGGWGEGIFARLLPFPFRLAILYFALRNAPPRERMLCLPRPPVRTQQIIAP